MNYNNKSRSINAVLASASGFTLQIVQILASFVYRTVFLSILSAEYLGINGLFSNVFQIFSLAELGIGTAILYSMYKPFSEHNTEKISALVHFYKQVYHVIAIVVALVGIAFFPFIGSIVNTAEVPADVNLTIVYFLFVFQGVSSYLFVYKQSILTADQRIHTVSFFSCGLLIACYAVRIVILALSRNYIWTLAGDIAANLLINFAFSLWITRKYRDIFRTKAKLPTEEKKHILKDTAGLLCHKIGQIVVTATDNIILSKFVNLIAVGLYSNYTMIVTAITSMANRIFGSLIPSIANYIINKTKEESYLLFKRLLFANMWISCFTTVCLYCLLNPFIQIWLGDAYLLSPVVVALICMQHYLQISRTTANNFVNGYGLFMRDRIRPLIESGINLAVSILLAIPWGIAGVLIGTCVSGLTTYFWREPYLIYKNHFDANMKDYWLIHAGWFVLTLGLCCGGNFLLNMLDTGIWGFICRGLLVVLVSNVIIFLLTCRTDNCRYFLNYIKRKVKRH